MLQQKSERAVGREAEFPAAARVLAVLHVARLVVTCLGPRAVGEAVLLEALHALAGIEARVEQEAARLRPADLRRVQGDHRMPASS